jgi:hypothetical protein
MTTLLKSLFVYLLCASAAWAGQGILPQMPKPQIDCDMKVDDAEYGLVIVSATLPRSDARIGNPNKFNYYYNTPKGSSFLGDKSITLMRESLSGKTESDFQDAFGLLFVLKLKAGDYEMRGWDYMDLDPRHTTYSPTRPAAKMPFRASAGRATYLGSLEVEMDNIGEDVFGKRIARAWPTLADRSKRDLSVLFKKCPAIDIMQVDVELLTQGPWPEQKETTTKTEKKKRKSS